MARYARQMRPRTFPLQPMDDCGNKLSQSCFRTRLPFCKMVDKLRDPRRVNELKRPSQYDSELIHSDNVDKSRALLVNAYRHLETTFDEKLDEVPLDWTDNWQAGDITELTRTFGEGSLFERIAKRLEARRRAASVKRRIWATMEDPHFSTFAYYLRVYISILILGAVLSFILESLHDLADKHSHTFYAVEIFVVANFSLELMIRFFSCPDKSAFARNVMNAIDLLAVLPFFVELLLNNFVGSFAGLRVLRLGRALRLLKISRRSQALTGFSDALSGSSETVVLLITILFFLMLVFAVFMFYAETVGTEIIDQEHFYKEQYRDDDVVILLGNRSQFQSIFSSMWWSQVTIMSVGYGDYTPVTYSGKAFAFVAIIITVMSLALPVTFLGENFREFFANHMADSLDLIEVQGEQVNLNSSKSMIKPQKHRKGSLRPPIRSDHAFSMQASIIRMTHNSLKNVQLHLEQTRVATEQLHARFDALEHIVDEIENYSSDDSDWLTEEELEASEASCDLQPIHVREAF